MIEDSSPKRATKGRPLASVPEGRDPLAELAHLKQWLSERPALKAGALSKAAGQHRATLSNYLTGFRRPQIEVLDALYLALAPYQYQPLTNVNKNN